MKLAGMYKPLIHKAITLFLLCLAPGFYAYAQKAPHSVTVLPLQEKALTRSYALIGTTESTRTINILNQEDGRILELPYFEGDLVKKGALLARIDDEELRAEIDKAVANRKQAETDLSRLEKLRPRNLASEDEVARARTQLELARAEEALLDTRLRETRIMAPFDGMVSERLMELGDLAPAHSHILTLYDPNALLIRVQLPEQLMPGIRSGHFTIQIPASADQPQMTATPKRIYPTLDSETHQVIVELQTESLPDDVVPGMLVSIDFTPAAQPQLWLPLAALHEDARGRFVYVYQEGKARRIPVVTGTITADHIRIRKGLKAGDEIIIAGFIGLRDGKAVTIERQNSHD
jgi:RND family efflux transporter MFP subunit